MGDFLDRNLLLWDRDTSNSGRSRWARRAIGAAGSTGRTNVQMVDEVRRIARESSATTSPIPRLGPDPFVDERAICEIRVIANQHGRAALWRNPPAGDAVAARWAGIRMRKRVMRFLACAGSNFWNRIARIACPH